MRSVLQQHRAILFLTGVFVILATIYSLVTPIFEASDELSHYPVVQYIATHWTLPVQQPGVETLWEQEGSQPPLYYVPPQLEEHLRHSLKRVLNNDIYASPAC